jgi:CRISPR-associated endoribonuclease Cas6
VHSVTLVLYPENDAAISKTMNPQTHALVLNLVRQFNSSLSARLHNEPGYRPFTVSQLSGLVVCGEHMLLQHDRPCYLRITLFDDGSLWQQLCTHFLESGPIYVQLGNSVLRLTRILSTPDNDPTGWVCSTDWQTLFTLSAKQSLTIHFVSPTAFSWGDRRFVLFPEPFLVWESLLHIWNRYAPESYRVERQGLREFLLNNVRVTKCSLHTKTLYFPNYTQKGFVGSCSYSFKAPDDDAALLTTLAAFAYYAGVGYKTTMGMGQVRVIFDDQVNDVVLLDGAQPGTEGTTCVTSALER